MRIRLALERKPDSSSMQPGWRNKNLNQRVNTNYWLGKVAHACNPSTLGGWGMQITWSQEFKTTLAHMEKPHSTKSTKISQVWWWAPVIPATWEAEAGELLEPGRRRLQWAKIMPLHSSLGHRVRLCLIKTKQNKKSTIGWARWLIPIIPTLWEGKAGRSLEVRSSRPTWPR